MCLRVCVCARSLTMHKVFLLMNISCHIYTLYYMFIEFVQSHMILRNSNICWNEADEKDDVKLHHCILNSKSPCNVKFVRYIHTKTLTKLSHSFAFFSWTLFFLLISFLCSHLGFWLPHQIYLPFLCTHTHTILSSWMSFKRMQYGVNEIQQWNFNWVRENGLCLSALKLMIWKIFHRQFTFRHINCTQSISRDATAVRIQFRVGAMFCYLFTVCWLQQKTIKSHK